MTDLTTKQLYTLGNHLIIETAVVFDPNIVPVLEETLLLVQERLRFFAGDPEFQQKMMLAFGKNIEINSLQTAWLRGDFSILSGIEIRQGTELNGANGAYGLSTDRIYLSEVFIRNNQDNLDALVSLVLEELGHHFDVILNGDRDSEGDEGELFSALVMGKPLSQQRIKELKAEDDTATIILNEKQILIEQQNQPATEGDDVLIGDRELDTSKNPPVWVQMPKSDFINGLGGNDKIYGRELVVCQVEIDGYSLVNLMRASSVVNCQSTGEEV